MTLSAEDRFNIEVIKLLLQLAWADQEVSERERLVIQGLGRSWSVPEHALHTLMEQLQAGGALPEPDLSVLRTRPDDVLEAARALSTADGRIAEREKSLLETIGARLGEPSRG